MRIIQIYPEFLIFDLPDVFFSSGYGHHHISGSLNFIKKYFPDFICQAILIYKCIDKTAVPSKALTAQIMSVHLRFGW